MMKCPTVHINSNKINITPNSLMIEWDEAETIDALRARKISMEVRKSERKLIPIGECFAVKISLKDDVLSGTYVMVDYQHSSRYPDLALFTLQRVEVIRV